MDEKLKEKVKQKLEEERALETQSSELKAVVKQKLQEERATEIIEAEIPPTERELAQPEIVWQKGFRKISVNVLSQYFREMSVLLQAGFSILQTLRVTGHGRSHRLMSATLTQVAMQVESGIALWRAMEKYPRVFPPQVISTVRAGEASGTLEEALTYLADNLEYEAEVRTKVRSAFDYPIFFGVLTLIILVFMFFFVLPRFQEVYAQLDLVKKVNSPYFSMLLEIQAVLPWVLLFGGLLFVGIWYAFRSRKFMFLERLKLRVPIFGRLLLLSDLTRFAKTLSVQAKSSVPILESLQLCQYVVDNRELSALVREIETHVEEGGQLSEKLNHHPLIPREMIDLMEIGEESGSLSTSMEYLAKLFQTRIENTISRLTALLQPFLLLVMGSIVVLVFVAMITPYFELLDKLQSSGFGGDQQVVTKEQYEKILRKKKLPQRKKKRNISRLRPLPRKQEPRSAPVTRRPLVRSRSATRADMLAPRSRHPLSPAPRKTAAPLKRIKPTPSRATSPAAAARMRPPVPRPVLPAKRP